MGPTPQSGPDLRAEAVCWFLFFFQAEDGIRDYKVTGVQTCALPIWTYVLAKALETYQHEYGVAYPQEERPAGRPEKTSPLYDHLRSQGAVFGARGGWERAVYYARRDDPEGPECSFRRPHWHRAVERECHAVANSVAMLELPGSAKFEIAGAGAAVWLDHLLAGRLPREGRTALGFCCSPRGGIVSEMTVSRLPDGRFWLMSAAAGEIGRAHV